MSDWFYNSNRMTHAHNAYELLVDKKKGDWNTFDSSAFHNYVEKCSHGSLEKPLNNIKHGTTLLHAAVELNNIHAVRILMDQNISLSEKDAFGYTPLDLAIKNNNKEMVELLTKNTTTDAKLSALHSDVSFHKNAHETESRKRKRCEEDNRLLEITNETLRETDMTLRRSLTSYENKYNTLVVDNKSYIATNNCLGDENRTLKRAKLSLERDNTLLKNDNATLIIENRKITKEKDTYKNRYEILKESTKK